MYKLYDLCSGRKNMGYLQAAIGHYIDLNDKIWSKCQAYLTDEIWKQITRLRDMPVTDQQIRSFVTELNDKCYKNVVEMLTKKYPELRKQAMRPRSDREASRPRSDREASKPRSDRMDMRPQSDPTRRYDGYDPRYDKRSNPADKQYSRIKQSDGRGSSGPGPLGKSEIAAFDGSMSGRGGFELAQWGSDSSGQGFGPYASAFSDVGGISEISRIAKGMDSRTDRLYQEQDSRFVDTRGSSMSRSSPYDYEPKGRHHSQQASYDALMKEREQEMYGGQRQMQIPDFSDDGSGSRPDVMAERKRRYEAALRRGPVEDDSLRGSDRLQDNIPEQSHDSGSIYDLYFAELGQQHQQQQQYQGQQSRYPAQDHISMTSPHTQMSADQMPPMMGEMGSFLTPQTSSASLYDAYDGKIKAAKTTELDKCLEREMAEREYFDRETKQPIQYNPVSKQTSVDDLPPMSGYASGPGVMPSMGSMGGFNPGMMPSMTGGSAMSTRAGQDISQYGFGQMPQMNPGEIHLPTY
jgi:hypothetical protein